MKTKDTILLEQAYKKVLKEDNFNRANEEDFSSGENSRKAALNILDSDEKFKTMGKRIDNFIKDNMKEMVSKFIEQHPNLVEGDPSDEQTMIDIESYFEEPLRNMLRSSSNFFYNLK